MFVFRKWVFIFMIFSIVYFCFTDTEKIYASEVEDHVLIKNADFCNISVTDTSNIRSYIASKILEYKSVSVTVSNKEDILHEEFDKIVVVTKFRPQSARRDMSDTAKQNYGFFY